MAHGAKSMTDGGHVLTTSGMVVDMHDGMIAEAVAGGSDNDCSGIVGPRRTVVQLLQLLSQLQLALRGSVTLPPSVTRVSHRIVGLER